VTDFADLLRIYDLAVAEAEAAAAAVEAKRKALAEAEAAAARAAHARTQAHTAVYDRLSTQGHHSLRDKEGRITIFYASPDHTWDCFNPAPGDRPEGK
jgi:hypothetical protein